MYAQYIKVGLYARLGRILVSTCIKYLISQDKRADGRAILEGLSRGLERRQHIPAATKVPSSSQSVHGSNAVSTLC